MLIDSGSPVNTLVEEFFEELQNSASSRLLNVSPCSDRKLTAYAGAPLNVVATFETDLYIDQARPYGIEKFYVVAGAKSSLLGRSTALRYKVLSLGLGVVIDTPMANVSAIQESVTPKAFPKFKIEPVKLCIDESVQPRRFTYTNIPVAYTELVRARITDMLKSDIIEELTPDMNNSFCSALLVVPKGKSDIRLVVDLRGANKSIIREPHNMPSVDKVMASLHGNVKFSTIDLSNAFSHVELNESSRHVTNFYSGDKFYRFKRLPFGLCNAPDIFQQTMEAILTGCNGVIIYLDDILVYGRSEKEHDENLKVVLERLSKHGVKINKDKCQLNRTTCTFLGFTITPYGYRVTNDHQEAIKKFRRPENIAELRSFLGLMNYVDKFIVNRVEKTDVLQEIIRSKQFTWTPEAEEAFVFIKSRALNDIKTLGYYCPEDRTELVVDASPIGLGAVLVQYNYGNRPRIIACASKSLTPVERRYSQIQKEALAMVWGVERFQYLLRGITFTIVTDAEANEFIFGKDYRLGKRAISRAEAWALRLLPFSFSVKTVEGRRNIADVFSRLIDKSQSDPQFDDGEYDSVLLISGGGEIPITWDEVECETGKDTTLQAVIHGLKSKSWPPGLERFQALRNHLFVVNGVVILKEKMVIPESLKAKVLDLAHKGHFGIQSMKRMLRSSVWWPNIGAAVEKLVNTCITCQRITRPCKPLPIASRELPEGPWQVLQIDFLKLPGCGTEEFFMITDTYSRMFWAIEMKRTDRESTIAALWDIFKVWGKCDILQSDNGPPFQSEDFSQYWRDHGITHHKVIPYCPFMNGMIERRNEGVIKAVKTAIADGENWRDALQDYVSKYNNLVPHSSTGATPFELMTGRKFKGFLPAIYNSNSFDKMITDDEVRERDALAKLRAKQYADSRRGARESSVEAGDWVLVSDKHRRNKLDPTYLPEKYTVLERDRQKVVVQSESGKIYNRYVADVRKLTPRDNEQHPNDIDVGDVVKKRQGKSPEAPDEDGFMSQRFKVLYKADDKIMVRSENGTELSLGTNAVKKTTEHCLEKPWASVTCK